MDFRKTKTIVPVKGTKKRLSHDNPIFINLKKSNTMKNTMQS